MDEYGIRWDGRQRRKAWMWWCDDGGDGGIETIRGIGKEVFNRGHFLFDFFVFIEFLILLYAAFYNKTIKEFI